MVMCALPIPVIRTGAGSLSGGVIGSIPLISCPADICCPEAVSAKNTSAAEQQKDKRHRQDRQRGTNGRCIAAIYIFQRTPDHLRLRRIACKPVEAGDLCLYILRRPAVHEPDDEEDKSNAS